MMLGSFFLAFPAEISFHDGGGGYNRIQNTLHIHESAYPDKQSKQESVMLWSHTEVLVLHLPKQGLLQEIPQGTVSPAEILFNIQGF